MSLAPISVALPVLNGPSCLKQKAASGMLLLGAWLSVGLVVGYLTRESVGNGMVGTISNMLAGAIVMSPLGAATILFGARGLDAMIGAATGGIALYSAGSLGTQPPTAQFLCIGIIMGALMATTGWPIVRKIHAFVGQRISLG